jgi:predicted HAD superfamily phosphohydrolase
VQHFKKITIQAIFLEGKSVLSIAVNGQDLALWRYSVIVQPKSQMSKVNIIDVIFYRWCYSSAGTEAE